MAFIALEGIDGCGKTTQAELLRDWLRKSYGRTAEILHNPGATPLGARIRELIKDSSVPMSAHSAALLFAAVRCDLADRIRQYSRDGVDVIVDRWAMSTLAYQGLEVPAAMLNQLQAFVGLQPDLTILVDVPVDVAMQRLAARDAKNGGIERNVRFERRELLENVAMRYRSFFDVLAKRNGGTDRVTGLTNENYVQINGNWPEDGVFGAIVGHVQMMLRTRGEISVAGAPAGAAVEGVTA